ncbi:MAG: Gfo/Idh/MocA family oxidoreductase [Gemmatimonadota bacterium]|nr:Gfo/Idh/MocA family oxidoreductase [Gemmatimonadota bacterium]MDQ8174790.1 Gfo/Idh/MocA family oxidoreductase [Gemmatimonadota bacterium]MDQ8177876.1 Gfo/Idh/MocA family oxidoreductase [Gemmatimonadota bacterium]
MTRPPVRVGVIGAGSLGFHHARLLRGVPGVAFHGIYEANAERAGVVSRELEIQAHPTLDALLAEVDAVSIVVPTPLHHQVAMAALARGKHLLIEKPITVTLAEADELLDLADRQGVVVQIGHIERFNRAVRAALPYVDHPLFIDSDRLAPFNPRGSDVAVVLDLMIHDIDLVLTLTGSPVTEVSAAGLPVLTPSIDIADARLRFASGAVATITSSRVSKDRMRKLRIFQRNGYLSLDLAAGTGEMYRLRGDVDLATLAQQAQPLEAFVERVPLEAPEGEPLKLELESFAAALRGAAPVSVTARAGRDALAVALQIVADIERGSPLAALSARA